MDRRYAGRRSGWLERSEKRKAETLTRDNSLGKRLKSEIGSQRSEAGNRSPQGAILHQRFNSLKRSGRWERPSFLFVKLNPFIDGLAKLLVNNRLVITVHTAQH